MIDILKREHNQSIPRPWQTVETLKDGIEAIREFSLEFKSVSHLFDKRYIAVAPQTILWAESYIGTEDPIAVLAYPGDITVKFYAFPRSTEN